MNKGKPEPLDSLMVEEYTIPKLHVTSYPAVCN